MNNRMFAFSIFSILTFAGCAKNSDNKVVKDGYCTTETVNAYNDVVYMARSITQYSTLATIQKLQNTCNSFKSFIGSNTCKADDSGVTKDINRNSLDATCTQADRIVAQTQTQNNPPTVNYCSDSFQQKYDQIRKLSVDRYTTESEFLSASSACSSMPSEALGEKAISCVHTQDKLTISSVGTTKKCQFITLGFIKYTMRVAMNDPKKKLSDYTEKLKIRFKEDLNKYLVQMAKLSTEVVVQDTALIEALKAVLSELPSCVLKKISPTTTETVFEKKDAVYKSIVTTGFAYTVDENKKATVTMTSAQSQLQIICSGKETDLSTVSDLKKIFGQKMDVDLMPFDLD